MWYNSDMDFNLNYLYRPERRLYYIPADIQMVNDYYQGKFPKEIAKYSCSFGTYDFPCLFKLNLPEYNGTVIGIEYKNSDGRIEYPENLSYIFLEETYLIAAQYVDSEIIDSEMLEEIVEDIEYSCQQEYFAKNRKIIYPYPYIQVNNRNDKILIHIPCQKTKPAVFAQEHNVDMFSKQELFRWAFHEYVTGHYNWFHMVPYLEEGNEAGIFDYAFAHFDIKDFSLINEIYGHSIGNKVLAMVGNAMTECDFVYQSARCHNDNFAMMIKDMPDEETRQKLMDFFNGISAFPECGGFKIAYRCGVVPMRNAINLGNRVADAGKLAQSLGTNINRTEIKFYTDQMYDDYLWSKQIHAHLNTAIEQDEFLVYFQPKYSVATKSLVGAEALIRWNFKHKKFLSPQLFVPQFENFGLISKVDDLVLLKVCEYFRKWKLLGKKLYPVSVNLSRKQMENSNLVDHLVQIVDLYDIDHSLIDFELTESASFSDKDYMFETLMKFRKKGFKISMDDFGTGFSSLSLLTGMPLDTLKIDKSFVDNIGTATESAKDISVMRHIISMAKDLKIHSLAEGVENEIQFERLKMLECEMIQGFYFSKPLPAQEYEKLLD